MRVRLGLLLLLFLLFVLLMTTILTAGSVRSETSDRAPRVRRCMNVFVSGATGYIGRHLIPELIARGHTIRALVRPASIGKLAEGAEPVVGDALNAFSFAHRLAPSDTFVQLVGVAHPSPAKAMEFQAVDLASIRESVRTVSGSTIRHFVYLSVAMPAPAMKAYVAVREEGERLVRECIRESGLAATFIRPWYVLGPGHRWPYAILPAYWIWSLFDRDTAARLYPVMLAQVVRTIADAIESPADAVRVIEAPEMRRSAQFIPREDAGSLRAPAAHEP
jgi:uncharacterized protein YbjT (DUF2867 family)